MIEFVLRGWREVKRRTKLLLAYVWIITQPRASAEIRAENAWLLGGAVGRMYGDNSAALHQYLLRTHPEISAYWVIDRDSPDVELAKAVGPVLYRDQISTYVRALLARVHVISHGVHDIPGFTSRHSKALRVRVGHGITATRVRKPSLVHSVEKANQLYDLVPVSSELEKRNKLTWGIPHNRLRITGLPRFDNLIRKQNHTLADPRRVLYMPTWRDFAVRSEKDFAESRYAHGIAEFISHPRLHALLERYDAYLDVVFHMIARPYATELLRRFGIGRVRMANVTDPQDLFVEVGALITDYSSVTWDFLYINKPVIFYQFDLDDFEHERGSYIEKREWPGPVETDVPGVIYQVQKYLSGEFNKDEALGKVVDEWKSEVFAFRDANNSYRVTQEILRCLEKC